MFDMFFKKLEFKLTGIPDFEKLKGEVVTSYGRHPRPSLTYYRLKDAEYLKSFLPENIPWKKLPPLQVQIAEIIDPAGGHLLPHIDHNLSAVVNYYIQTGRSTTHFYKLKNGGAGFVYPGRQTANIFTLDQVDKVSDFTADDGDIYALDVSNIHSVETPKPGIRQFIQWQWVGIPFDEVLEILSNC